MLASLLKNDGEDGGTASDVSEPSELLVSELVKESVSSVTVDWIEGEGSVEQSESISVRGLGADGVCGSMCLSEERVGCGFCRTLFGDGEEEASSPVRGRFVLLTMLDY